MPESLMPAPAGLEPYARTVVAGDLRLHCYVGGPEGAPALVLIHGLGDEADSWRRVFAPLSQSYRVIALDLPGFGRSDRPRRAYTVGFFARAAADLMAALGIGRATLAGSSMGGMIAQRLALAAPQLVERLILIDGCLPTTRTMPSGPIWAFLTPGAGELAYTRLRRSQDEAYATLRPYYADLDALPPEERAFLRARVWARVWSDGQRRAFLSALRWLSIDGATRADSYRRLLRSCPTPTHLIWGDHDVIAPISLAHANAALQPNAQLSVISSCGHLPHQERPDKLLDLLE
jgi:pimeloyl-ACP methyl ester carboxylesterase